MQFEDPSLGAFRSPDLSAHVIHFVSRRGRINRTILPAISSLTPEQRLRRILTSRTIQAFPVFGSRLPVACFAECTRKGAEALLQRGYYEPWAIAVRKVHLYGYSGGPVFYVRDDEWRLMSHVDDRIQARSVRFSPLTHGSPYSNWTHEREWRATRSVPITRDAVPFLVVPTHHVLPGWLKGYPLVRFDTRTKRLVDANDIWDMD